MSSFYLKIKYFGYKRRYIAELKRRSHYGCSTLWRMLTFDEFKDLQLSLWSARINAAKMVVRRLLRFMSKTSPM